MAVDFDDEPDLEELRRREMAQRARRRQARERGEIPVLSARFRKTASPSENVATPSPQSEPVTLSARADRALRRMAQEAGVPDLFVEVLARAGAADDPPAVVVEAVREHLLDRPPLLALRYLAELAHGGLPTLTDDELSQSEALLAERLPAPPSSPAHPDAWQIHLEAVEAAGRGVLSGEAWHRLAGTLPLPVLDDFIDAGTFDRRVLPALRGLESREAYLVARLAPEELTEAELSVLGWQDETKRRALHRGEAIAPLEGCHDQWSLRSALLGGETAGLDPATITLAAGKPLPSALAQFLQSLQSIRRGGALDRELGNDRGLFAVLEDWLPQGRLIAGRAAFHYWAGTRRLYRLLDELHWAMAVEPETVPDTLRGVVQQASALRNEQGGATAGRADREARVVLAYVYFLTARPGERDRLDHAVGLLEELIRRGAGRPGGLGGQTRSALKRLSALLQALRQKHKPQDVLNPYLALCVEHGSTEWRHGWRNLRRQVSGERLEDINSAKDRIQRLDAAKRLGAPSEPLYAMPLDERFLWVPPERSPLLYPPAQPLERRTNTSTEEELQWSASEAARELIGRSAGSTRNND
ncbi:hypothetical protein ACH470_15875 [Streptomyces bottropensis]|uniref:hypothetical protein n=1 Tax=Streptomyces bottropensis TaxID=42235 RepID=UPI00378BFF01